MKFKFKKPIRDAKQEKLKELHKARFDRQCVKARYELWIKNIEDGLEEIEKEIKTLEEMK